jgi:hypothetical protein
MGFAIGQQDSDQVPFSICEAGFIIITFET